MCDTTISEYRNQSPTVLHLRETDAPTTLEKNTLHHATVHCVVAATRFHTIVCTSNTKIV